MSVLRWLASLARPEPEPDEELAEADAAANAYPLGNVTVLGPSTGWIDSPRRGA